MKFSAVTNMKLNCLFCEGNKQPFQSFHHPSLLRFSRFQLRLVHYIACCQIQYCPPPQKTPFTNQPSHVFFLITAQRAGLSTGTCKKGAFALERLLNMAKGKQARQKRSLIKFNLKDRQTGGGRKRWRMGG